jgi:DNA mismatch repair protein MSH6
VAITEICTNVITLGFINDDDKLSMFKTMLCQIKPVEVVIDPENVSTEIVKVLKSGYIVPIVSQVGNKLNRWHKGVAYNHVEHVHGAVTEGKWPRVL